MVSSAAKTFCVTGWKVGWATGPASLIGAMHDVKQYLSFASGTPFRHAVAEVLADADDVVAALQLSYRERRDVLGAALGDAGYVTTRPSGGYFLTADAAPFGVRDAASLWDHCERLPETTGVIGIPGSVFTDRPDVTTVRFCFAKSRERIETAVARLGACHPPSSAGSRS